MLTFIAAVSLLAWLYLYFVHHGFWTGDQRLPHDVRPLASWPSVVAIVPARNEAPTIARCIAALTAQRYEGSLRIIVVDDGSTDGTADLARGAGPTEGLTVMTAPALAQGWTGKLWAMNAGLGYADASGLTPVYFWFTDADVVHAPDTLMRLVGKAQNKNRDLVSLMVKLHCRHAWERLLIPAFVFFFQMLYPFRAVNDDRSKIAAAAGGCVLLRRETLASIGGLDAMRGAIIDDCTLGRLVKQAGGRLWLGLADDSVGLREATGLAPLWAMVRRTAFAQLRYSAVLLVLTLIGLALVFLAPPLLVCTWLLHGNLSVALGGLGAWGLMAACYGPTLKDYGQNPRFGAILPVAAALYAVMTFSSAVAHWRHQGGSWKGRIYTNPGAPSAGVANPPESP